MHMCLTWECHTWVLYWRYHHSDSSHGRCPNWRPHLLSLAQPLILGGTLESSRLLKDVQVNTTSEQLFSFYSATTILQPFGLSHSSHFHGFTHFISFSMPLPSNPPSTLLLTVPLGNRPSSVHSVTKWAPQGFSGFSSVVFTLFGMSAKDLHSSVPVYLGRTWCLENLLTSFVLHHWPLSWFTWWTY